MNSETGRICPFCAEAIQPAAKVCPRCRQWLTIRSLRNPAASLWLNGVPLVAILVVMGFSILDRFDRVINPRPAYSALPHALHILESRMNWAQTKDGLRIYMTGILTNQSSVPWRDIEFECRFYGSAGAMIDAAHSHGYGTVEPQNDSAFRAVVMPACATNDYSSYKLSVSTARNAKGWL